MNQRNGKPHGPILVVDDDGDFCLLVSNLLEPRGFDVVDVRSGTDALVRARENRPALVLLDVHLPDVSGYQVCRELRDEFGNELPIIFVSGMRTEDYDREAGLLLGADDYVVKPFAFGDLIARVRRAIDRTAPRSNGTFGLTARELDVLELLSEGLNQAHIASRLFITEKTVATHIQRILAKLGVHSRAEAVALAHRHHLFAAG